MRLLRYFSITSFIAILIVAVVLTTLYERLAVKHLIAMEEHHNIALTQTFANSLWPQFAPFVQSAGAFDADKLKSRPENLQLYQAVSEQMSDTPVVKIKVYDLGGRTVFSTEARQLGEDKSQNGGYISARAGTPVSELTHRNQFSAFESTVSNIDVISSYIPIRRAGSKDIEGVFEIYEDITPLLAKIHDTRVTVALSVTGVLSLLYAVLFTIVLRADRVIRRQDALRQQQEQALRRMVLYDHHTGLPNRAFFTQQVRRSLAHSDRNGKPLAIMFLDLDRFKRVNDTLGHSAGDELLKQAALRMRECLRPVDSVGHGAPIEDAEIIARLGGDEFTIVLEDLDKAKSAAVSARRILEELAKPYFLKGQEVNITCSIGIAVYPQDGKDVDNLLQHADAAMYHAKQQGRNNFQFYDRAMNMAVGKSMSLERGLRKALECGQFVLHHQPVMDTLTGRIVGTEALIRWNHPELGLLPPSEFITLAEELGLIVPIGEWVMRTACEQTAAWHAAGFKDLFVAINLASPSFNQRNLDKTVDQILTHSGLDRRHLTLEVTESMLMRDVGSTVRTLQRLKDMSVKIAVDDFGTGYSSLSYLSRFPIDVLKIDQSFVKDSITNPASCKITSAIIALSQNLQLDVIAEGVETEGQLTLLRQLGCRHMQGYLFSRPLPAYELTEMLQQKRAERHAQGRMSPAVLTLVAT